MSTPGAFRTPELGRCRLHRSGTEAEVAAQIWLHFAGGELVQEFAKTGEVTIFICCRAVVPVFREHIPARHNGKYF